MLRWYNVIKKANKVNKRYRVKVITIIEDNRDVYIYWFDNNWLLELEYIVRPVNFTFIDWELY
jgi:hypothetical protein